MNLERVLYHLEMKMDEIFLSQFDSVTFLRRPEFFVCPKLSVQGSSCRSLNSIVNPSKNKTIPKLYSLLTLTVFFKPRLEMDGYMPFMPIRCPHDF